MEPTINELLKSIDKTIAGQTDQIVKLQAEKENTIKVLDQRISAVEMDRQRLLPIRQHLITMAQGEEQRVRSEEVLSDIVNKIEQVEPISCIKCNSFNVKFIKEHVLRNGRVSNQYRCISCKKRWWIKETTPRKLAMPPFKMTLSTGKKVQVTPKLKIPAVVIEAVKSHISGGCYRDAVSLSKSIQSTFNYTYRTAYTYVHYSLKVLAEKEPFFRIREHGKLKEYSLFDEIAKKKRGGTGILIIQGEEKRPAGD